MNVKFINPFVEAAQEVLTIEVREKVIRGDLQLDSSAYITDDVTVVISIIGAVDGTVFLSMSKDSATQFSSIIIGEKLATLDRLAQSGVAELGNVIVGRAAMKMAEGGFEVNISTPSLIMGKGATISTLDYPRLIVPLKTSMGTLVIHLALREGSQGGLKTPQMPTPKAVF